jgi:formylglycine-generating enzyme required for sulfatase activity
LPDLDTDIKGGMRSHAELLAASGYQDRPTDFNDLLRILDGELRLITPTDPEGTTIGEPDASASGSLSSGTNANNLPAYAGGSPRSHTSGTNANNPPAEGAASQDEGTEQKDESDSTEPAKDEAKPEPPPDPLPPRTFYYTFIVFPSGGSLIGSVEDEPERSVQENRELRHVVNLTHPFALLDREVTFEELIAFSPAYAGFMQQFNGQRADAGFGPHWYDSVAFCRWLSQQSGLSESDQSYADPESMDVKEYAREPNPEATWAPRIWPLELNRRGFPLPTESEWEIASRAGARTTYGYGSDVALLDQFGWFQENSDKHVHPPRELRPTIRGAFDLHGNLLERTHDWYGAFRESAVTDPLGAKGGSVRMNCGGSWSSGAVDCRSASRGAADPSFRTVSDGFRIALSSPSGVSSPAEQVQGK